ncbi:MAG: DUF523 domain-containing protein [Anaerovoracaceae bacterium]
MYLISGCLLGHNCKYNGGNNRSEKVVDFASERSFLAVCPEGCSGLPVPRPPAEFAGERIVDREGRDVTEAFRRGAELSLRQALEEAERRGEKIEGAILKANSPSCGSGRIYDGTFSGRLKEGYGCFAEMLYKRGIKVISEKEIDNDKF